MSVVSLPRQYGPKAPRHIARRVAYRRRPLATVVTLPARTDASQAYSLYLRACEVDEVDNEAGIALYERAIALDPKLALAYTNLGNCYFRLDRRDLAASLFQRAIEIDPAQPEAHHNLGYIKLRAGDVEGAIRMLEASVELDPLFAEGWYNLGMAREQRLGTHCSPAVRVCFQRFLKLAAKDDTYRVDALRRLA